MSKIKTPREKKMARLLHDRRNAYGENDKSSRKNIPLNKRLSHKATRRSANQPLAWAAKLPDEDSLVQAEQLSRDNLKVGERKSFRKRADASLAATIEKKTTGKWNKLYEPWG